MFTQKEINFIESKGISIDEFQQQLQQFQAGFPYINIIKPATINEGIISMDQSIIHQYSYKFEENSKTKSIINFVPASGAATRMFKDLYEYAARPTDEPKHEVLRFFENISNFPFYNDLKDCLNKDDLDLDDLLDHKEYSTIIDYVLTHKGLNLGNKPKGLLKFHRYDTGCRTAIEEHLVETVSYITSLTNTVNLHFTVSPEHVNQFVEFINKVKDKYEERFKVHYNISFSIQSPSTDKIAVDSNNFPFRDETGNLLFRPAGHGALLSNLNGLDADVVFIKNIDNIAPDHIKESTIQYKKVLGGLLLSYEKKIFRYLNLLDEDANPVLLDEIAVFLEKRLNVIPSKDLLDDQQSRIIYFREKLDRPLRVCGVVKNEGEPGGAPFWVANLDGSMSLQIVESSQVNHEDEMQELVFKNSGYFNPVDIVCGLKNYKGKKFNLMKYSDPLAGIITRKTWKGKQIKVQELPGLWNGSMSDWNTILVEVPISTFTPVKSINDLLRKEHQ